MIQLKTDVTKCEHISYNCPDDPQIMPIAAYTENDEILSSRLFKARFGAACWLSTVEDRRLLRKMAV